MSENTIGIPCTGNWMTNAGVVVYYALAAHAFNVGIKCRHCRSACQNSDVWEEVITIILVNLPHQKYSCVISRHNGCCWEKHFKTYSDVYFEAKIT